MVAAFGAILGPRLCYPVEATLAASRYSVCTLIPAAIFNLVSGSAFSCIPRYFYPMRLTSIAFLILHLGLYVQAPLA